MNRRAFLFGASAVAVTAAIPAAMALPEVMPLYAGSVGEWGGIVIKSRNCGATLTLDHLRRAKAMAMQQPHARAHFHLVGKDGTVMVVHPSQWPDISFFR